MSIEQERLKTIKNITKEESLFLSKFLSPHFEVIEKALEDYEIYKRAFELVCNGDIAKRMLDQARKEI